MGVFAGGGRFSRLGSSHLGYIDNPVHLGRGDASAGVGQFLQEGAMILLVIGEQKTSRKVIKLYALRGRILANEPYVLTAYLTVVCCDLHRPWCLVTSESLRLGNTCLSFGHF